MKKILAILSIFAIIGLSASCKKENIKPIENQQISQVSNIRILIDSKSSKTIAKIQGVFEFRDYVDTTTSNPQIYYTKYINHPNDSQYSIDTTFIIMSSHIEVLSYLESTYYNTNGYYFDMNVNTNVKIWVNGQLKYSNSGYYILDETILN